MNKDMKVWNAYLPILRYPMFAPVMRHIRLGQNPGGSSSDIPSSTKVPIISEGNVDGSPGINKKRPAIDSDTLQPIRDPKKTSRESVRLKLPGIPRDPSDDNNDTQDEGNLGKGI
jgi:hypothetical protein